MSLTVDCAVTERAGRSFIIGLQVTRRAGVFQDEKKKTPGSDAIGLHYRINLLGDSISTMTPHAVAQSNSASKGIK